jgi:hypothetical protein
VQVGLDRRQGDVHDCHVEDDHELGGHDQGEGKPSFSVLDGSHSCSKLPAHVNAIHCTMVFVDTLVLGARCEAYCRRRATPDTKVATNTIVQ